MFKKYYKSYKRLSLPKKTKVFAVASTLLHSRRDPFAIANRRSQVRRLPMPGLYTINRHYRRTPLFEVQDTRTWHPSRYGRPILTTGYGPARLRAMPKGNERYRSSSLWSGVGFMYPGKVLVCIRRKQRKEILHAIGVAGSSGLRKPKYNKNSGVIC